MSKHIVIDARIRRSSTGRYTDRLVEHLQKIDKKNHYTVLVQPDDNWKMRAENFATLPCPFPQFSFNPLNELRFAWQLYGLKPDLVHFTMTQQPLAYFGNIVTTTHDLTMLDFIRKGNTPLPLYWLKLALYRFLVKWSHVKSKHIIVPTNTTAKEVAKFQPSTKLKLTVTYEAAEPRLAEKSAQPNSVSGSFIMYTGTAFPHKNLKNLILAFDTLQKTNPNLKLVLVGKREVNSYELEEWAKSRPSYKNIIFTGFVSDTELKWLYEHAEVYVFTSLSEGFGLPPLEAMTNGAPVVSSNASVMPEVYGDAVLYCNPKNPEDIASKVDTVLKNKALRQRLIKAGYQQIKKYSWPKMAQETLDVYKKLLKH